MGEFFEWDKLVLLKPRSLNTLKIAVQNASGQPNLSQRVVDFQNKGFDNVYTVSDWPDLKRQTEIIPQGNKDAATNLKF